MEGYNCKTSYVNVNLYVESSHSVALVELVNFPFDLSPNKFKFFEEM